MPTSRGNMNRLLLISGALACALTGQALAADWEVNTVSDAKKTSCFIASAKRPISDGYQEITAQIIVDDKSILVKSDSVLDPSFSDIGLKVGSREFVHADNVKDKQAALDSTYGKKDRQATFDSNYEKIVPQFKAGRETTVQLRFWPTWPATGTHSASFTLIGFTKAYLEAMNCK